MKVALGIIACLAVVTGCRANTEASDVKITNGIVIPEGEQPAVVSLLRRILDDKGNYKGGATCTATWIDVNTLITAAHCLGDGESDSSGKMLSPQLVVFEILDPTSTPKLTATVTNIVEAYRNKKWEAKKGFNNFDLAILKTQPPRSNERPRGKILINHDGVAKGAAVEIIGYGFNNMSTFGKGGDDLKRIGNNVIASSGNGFLNIEGLIKDAANGPTGEKASAGNGDSGGPMLHDGQLIGVASGGGSGGLFARGEASYVDLRSQESKDFLSSFGY